MKNITTMKAYYIIVRNIYNNHQRIIETIGLNVQDAMSRCLREHPGFVGVGFQG